MRDIAARKALHPGPASMIAACTVAAFALASACAGPPSRTGSVADPVTIRSVYGNGPGGVGADVLEQLVAASSGSPVTVERGAVLPDATTSLDEEGDSLAALRAGRHDLSVIRADRFVTAGVTSLAALQVPFLVQSPVHAVRVADDALAADLMAGLAKIDLVGLALVPGGLRHPFAYGGEPLLVPADYRGSAFNTRMGAGVEEMFAAVGATVDHSVASERSDKVRARLIAGIETSVQQLQAVERPAVLTSNVTLYSKYDVVVVRRQAYDGLTAAQQRELAALARKAGRAAYEKRPTEQTGLQRWCTLTNAASVQATSAQVAALEAAMAPAADRAKADPTTAALVARIEALGTGTAPSPGITCGTPGAAVRDMAYRVKPVGDQTVLDGVWRVDVRPEPMRAAGVPEDKIAINIGVWTFTLENGRGTVDQPTGDDCEVQFTFAGRRVTMDFAVAGNANCGGLALGTFRRDGDVVSFRWEKDIDEELALDNAFFAGGMHKIADAKEPSPFEPSGSQAVLDGSGASSCARRRSARPTFPSRRTDRTSGCGPSPSATASRPWTSRTVLTADHGLPFPGSVSRSTGRTTAGRTATGSSAAPTRGRATRRGWCGTVTRASPTPGSTRQCGPAACDGSPVASPDGSPPRPGWASSWWPPRWWPPRPFRRGRCALPPSWWH